MRTRTLAPVSTFATLACPTCAATHLTLVERLTGTAGRTRIRRAAHGVDVAYDGSTEVQYQGAETVGVRCPQCRWEYHGADWAEQLAAH